MIFTHTNKQKIVKKEGPNSPFFKEKKNPSNFYNRFQHVAKIFFFFLFSFHVWPITKFWLNIFVDDYQFEHIRKLKENQNKIRPKTQDHSIPKLVQYNTLVSYLIYNYNSGVRASVRRRFRVLIDWRNRPGQSDSGTGNRPGQSDSGTGNRPGQSDSAN
jgi:hypothetical protein